MSAEGYYDILGVKKQSTQEEIRKAFRRLSLIHHPDRNGGTDDSEFQKINEAYETLSDPQKRRIYDITSQNPFMHGNAMHGNAMEVPIDASALFSMLFSQELGNDPDIHVFQGTFPMGGMQGMHNVKMPFHMPEPEPIVKTISITMKESYTGCCKPLEIERWTTSFNRKIRETETLYIDIPEGIGNNETILLKQKGNMVSHKCTGDIKIIVEIQKGEYMMERDGLDIIYKHKVTLKEALCGFSFSLKHISGKEFKINNTKGNIISPGFKKVVPGYGFKRNEHEGNLIIEFIIEFPDILSQEQISTIENIF
jgi:DnaJ family protein B protein 4